MQTIIRSSNIRVPSNTVVCVMPVMRQVVDGHIGPYSHAKIQRRTTCGLRRRTLHSSTLVVCVQLRFHIADTAAKCCQTLYGWTLVDRSRSRQFFVTILHEDQLTHSRMCFAPHCVMSRRARLDAFLRRSKRYGYCADDVPTITDLFLCC